MLKEQFFLFSFSYIITVTVKLLETYDRVLNKRLSKPFKDISFKLIKKEI